MKKFLDWFFGVDLSKGTRVYARYSAIDAVCPFGIVEGIVTELRMLVTFLTIILIAMKVSGSTTITWFQSFLPEIIACSVKILIDVISALGIKYKRRAEEQYEKEEAEKYRKMYEVEKSARMPANWINVDEGDLDGDIDIESIWDETPVRKNDTPDSEKDGV